MQDFITYPRIGPLVRAVSSTSAVLWAEFAQPGSVTLWATSDSETLTLKTQTIMVGGHYFAAPQLQGLQPATWYDYSLSLSNGNAKAPKSNTFGSRQCFRTLDQLLNTQFAAPENRTLRIAYGSCRKSNNPQVDVLNGFGKWLIDHFDQRETLWPHLLLLIGDQIYADEPPPQLVQSRPQLEQGAHTFEDFACMYEHAWTSAKGVRQVLANIPTYMIFDDHEITNDFNIWPGWRAKVLKAGLEQTLIDGMVAYWLYQGWGNLSQRDADQPLLAIMQEAEQSGDDALETLRDCIREDVYGRSQIRWHYELPTEPPIFVANARTERTAILSDTSDEIFAPTRIIGQQQTDDLRDWMQVHDTDPAIVVSSVPVLLPPVIGLAEYMMGIRPLHTAAAPLHWLGTKLAHIQQQLGIRTSFDHWPIYPVSWHALVQLLRERHGDIVILSGDVHFSYAMEAHSILQGVSSPYLYQFVSTPLENDLGASSQWKVELQAHVSHIAYGGLFTRVLPMEPTGKPASIRDNLLYQNTLALVTLQATGSHSYAIQHAYFGIVAGSVEIIARTTLKSKPKG